MARSRKDGSRRRVMGGLRAGALVVLLAACTDPGPGAALTTYLERLERPLATAAPAWEPVALPRPPRPPRLRIAIAPGRLDALDFLALRGCELQVTVGKRNSSLGRLAPSSQALLLELEFLRLAPTCIEHLETTGRQPLAGILQAALEDKHRELPVRIYNATLATEEFRDLWQAPAQLGDYPADTNTAPLSALEAVSAQAARWLSGDHSADNRAFEQLLSEIAQGDGGSLLAALRLQQAGLQAANDMLAARRRQGPLCAGPYVPAEVAILKTVVAKFFVGGIQPWSAALGRREHGLLPPIRRLEAQLTEVLPPAYRDWQSDRDAALRDAIRAPREHVQQIQDMLDGCEQAASGRPLETVDNGR